MSMTAVPGTRPTPTSRKKPRSPKRPPRPPPRRKASRPSPSNCRKKRARPPTPFAATASRAWASTTPIASSAAPARRRPPSRRNAHVAADEIQVRSVRLFYSAVFFGGLGLIAGVIFGASFGIFNILGDWIYQFPLMLQEMRGKIPGRFVLRCHRRHRRLFRPGPARDAAGHALQHHRLYFFRRAAFQDQVLTSAGAHIRENWGIKGAGGGGNTAKLQFLQAFRRHPSSCCFFH